MEETPTYFTRADVNRLGKVTVHTQFGVALLRKRSPDTLLAEGALTLPLLREAIALEQRRGAGADVADEQLRSSTEVMRKVVIAASDKPRIVAAEDPADPDAVPIADFDFDDVKAMFFAVTGTTAQLRGADAATFPDGATGDAPAAGSDGETVRAEAVVVDPANAVELQHG